MYIPMMHAEIVIIESMLDQEINNRGDPNSSSGMICNRCQVVYRVK